MQRRTTWKSFFCGSRKRRDRRARLTRSSRSEVLEKRQLLAADLAGDQISSAQIVTMQPNVPVEIDAEIGDGDFANADVDFYRINLAAGQSVSIDIDAYYDDNGASISDLDSYLQVFNGNGDTLNSAGQIDEYQYRYGYDDSPNDYWHGYSDDYLLFTAAESGTYFIGVSSQGNLSYDPMTAGTGYGQSYSSYTGEYRLQLLADSPPLPALIISDKTVDEAVGTASVEVSLSMQSDEVVTVDYATVDGTASATGDYAATSGTLSFAPGELSKSIAVSIVDDAVMESAESFTLELSNPVGAPVTAGVATISISDDDPDLAGDDLLSARQLMLSAGVMLEIDATIGDGQHGVKDVDLYRLDIAAGQTVSIDIDAYYDDNGGSISNLDSYLRVFNADGSDVTPSNGYSYGYATSPNDYSYGWSDDYLSFTAAESGTYYFGVSSQANTSYNPNTGGSGYGNASYTGDYRLQLLTDSAPEPELSIADVSIDEDAGTATLTVSLSMPSSNPVSVSYGTTDGTALAASDYEAIAGMVTFSPGELTKLISIPIVDDNTMESLESFTVALSNPAGAPIATGVATVSVSDDDPDLAGDDLSTAQPIQLSTGGMLEIAATIGDGQYETMDVDLYRVDIAAGQTVSIDIDAYYDDNGIQLSSLDSYLRIFDSSGSEIDVINNEYGYSYRYGYAHSPNDYGFYNHNDDYLTFTAEDTAVFYIGVSSQSNNVYDPTTAGSGYSSSYYSDKGDYRLQLIASEPPAPTLSVDDVSVEEDAGSATVNVALSMPSDTEVSVSYQAVAIDNGADVGADFVAMSGMVTFAPGELTQSISIPIVADDVMEADETFSIVLSDANGAPVAKASAIVTILDDDPDLAGDTTTEAQLVSLNGSQMVEIDALIGDGLQGNSDVDFYQVQLAAGQSLSVDVDAYQDDSGNWLSDLDSYIRIFNADSSEVTDFDGYSYSYRYGYAASPNDYDESYWNYSDDYLAFTAATTGVYFIGISSTSNKHYDPNSTANRYGSAYGSSLGAYRLQLTTDGPATPVVSATATDASEDAGEILFVVSLGVASEEPVTVNYATQDGGASGGSDYIATSGTLTFAPGETSSTIAVAITDDEVMEGDESFALSFTNAIGAEIATSSVYATILNDDPDAAGDSIDNAEALSLSPNVPITIDANIGDGVHGASDVDLYRVELGYDQSIAIDIDTYDNASGHTLSSLDSVIRVFDALGRDVTVDAGVFRSGDDSSPEEIDDGTFTPGDDFLNWTAQEAGVYYIGISSQANAWYSPLSENSASVDASSSTMGDYRVELTTTAPAVPVISIEDVAIARNQTTARFEVTLDFPSDEVATVEYTTVAGTAFPVEDYVHQTGTVTFQPGETVQVITVEIADGAWVEPTETFNIELSNPVGATIDLDAQTGTGIIIGVDDLSLNEPSIGLDSLGVPYVTLNGGIRLGPDTALGASSVSYLATSGVGTFTGDTGGTWTYQETYDAPRVESAAGDAEGSETNDDTAPIDLLIDSLSSEIEDGYDDSLEFTFIASGDANGTVYTIAVLGGRLDEDTDGNFDRQELNYTLTVETDPNGEITDVSVIGTATTSYMFSLTDQPLSVDDDFSLSSTDSTDGSTAAEDANTYSILLHGDSTITFGEDGIEFDSFDSETYSFSYTETNALEHVDLSDPDSSDPDASDSESSDIDVGDEPPAADDTSGEDASDESDSESTPSSETITVSGVVTETLTVSSSLDRDGSIVSFSSTETWDDFQSLSYLSSVTYSDGELSGTLTDNFSDSYHDDGSFTATYVAPVDDSSEMPGDENAPDDPWTYSGNANTHSWGDSTYSDIWSASYTVDTDTMNMTGSTNGSTVITTSYDYQLSLELTLAPEEATEEGDDSNSETSDDATAEPNDESQDVFVWTINGGSVLDRFDATDTFFYNAEGTYNDTAGVGIDDDGVASELGAGVSGTVTSGGNTSNKVWDYLEGTFAEDGDFTTTVAEVGYRDDVMDTFTLDATGTINAAASGGLSGDITIFDSSLTTGFETLSVDYVSEDPVTTGSAGSTAMITSLFVQTASGDRTLGDMTGSQHANINNSSTFSSTVQMTWDDSLEIEPDDDEASDEDGATEEGTTEESSTEETSAADDSTSEGEDDPATGGWAVDLVSINSTVSDSTDIGYDVSGSITIDGMSGDATQGATLKPSSSMTMAFDVSGDSEPTSSFSVSNTYIDSYYSTHNLTGSFTDSYGDPDVDVSGTNHDIAEVRRSTSIGSGITIESDDAPVLTGHFTTSDYNHTDTGRDGTSDYTRVDGDTTFTGTATLSDQNIVTTNFFLTMTMDGDGNWVVGDPDPLSDELPSRSTLYVMSTADNSYSATGDVAPDGTGDVEWTGTASEGGSVYFRTTVNTEAFPSIVDPLATDDGSEGDDAPVDDTPTDELSDETGDESADEGASGDEEDTDDSGFPELEWATSGTQSQTVTIDSSFSRNATGVYDDGELTGDATESITVNWDYSRNSDSELQEGESDWQVTSGTGTSGSLVSTTYSMNATGDTTLGALSGTITVENSHNFFDNPRRTDTFNEESGDWDATGTRSMTSGYNSSSTIDVSGDEATTAGGMALTATRTIIVGQSSSGDQSITSELQLAPESDESDSSEADSDRYEWAILTGNRSSESGSNSTVRLDGTGSETRDLNGVSLTYTLTRDDATILNNKTVLEDEYDPQSEDWVSGGYTKSTADVDLINKANGVGTYVFTIEGGGGTGYASHDVESVVTTDQDDKILVGTPPNSMDLPILDGTYSTTQSFTNKHNNQGGTTISQDAGGSTLALGSMTFERGASQKSESSFTLDREEGSEEWERGGSTLDENSNHDNFFSTLGGEWASPGGGEVGTISGSFNKTAINNNLNSYKTEGELNADGEYDVTTTNTRNFDHQNLSTHGGAGTYETVVHDLALSGIISISRTSDDVDTQNLTTTIAPDGSVTREGDGNKRTTRDSSRSASATASGYDSWDETHPIEGGSRIDTITIDRFVDQGYTVVNNATTTQLLGVIGNEFGVLSTNNSGFVQNDRNSTIDVTHTRRSVTNATYDNGYTEGPTVRDYDTTSINHTVSTLDRKDSLTTNTVVDTEDPSNDTNERSGSASINDSEVTNSTYVGYVDVTNGILHYPGIGPVTMTFRTEYDNEYRSEDKITGDTTYNESPDADTGSTTYTANDFERTDETTTMDGQPYSSDQYTDDYSEEVTVELNDPASSHQWIPVNSIESSSPPITGAAPSASVSGPSSESGAVSANLALVSSESEQFVDPAVNEHPPEPPTDIGEGDSSESLSAARQMLAALGSRLGVSRVIGAAFGAFSSLFAFGDNNLLGWLTGLRQRDELIEEHSVVPIDSVPNGLNDRDLLPPIDSTGPLTASSMKNMGAAHTNGSIRYGVVYAGGIYFVGAVAREAAIELLGMKGVDLASDGGRLVLKTDGGKWFIKAGEDFVELTAEQFARIKKFVAPRIGVNQVPVSGAAKRSWPRISAVAPDWATKGAHIHVNGVELAVRPGVNGTIVLKPVFSSTSSSAFKSASKAATKALEDIGYRQRLHNAAVRALQNIPSDSGKAAELRFLIAALQKLGV